MTTRTHDIDTARIVEAYRVRTPRSCAAHRRAVRRLPGGVNRNITHLSPHPLYVDSGEGAYLVDLDGNRYLDLLGNYTSMILGCGDASTARAIVSQLARGSAWAAASAAEFKLADAISERVPSMQQVGSLLPAPRPRSWPCVPPERLPAGAGSRSSKAATTASTTTQW